MCFFFEFSLLNWKTRKKIYFISTDLTFALYIKPNIFFFVNVLTHFYFSLVFCLPIGEGGEYVGWQGRTYLFITFAFFPIVFDFYY